MATLRNDTVIRSADGQATSAIVTAANIGTYGVATNSTYYVGTTQNIFNRASGAQTLTGVSIDGNAATVTNGLTTSNYVGYSAFTSSLTSTVDVRGPAFYDSNDTAYYLDPNNATSSLKIRSSIVINNVTAPQNFAMLNIGFNGGTETRAIDIQGGWSAGESKSITYNHGTTSADIVAQINAQHNGPGSRLRFGKLYHSGNSTTYTMELVSESATTAALYVVGSVRSPIFYDNDNTAYYLDPANTGTSLSVAGNIGIGATAPDTNLQVVGHVHVGNQTTFENTGGWNKTIYLDGAVHARLRILGSAYASGKNSSTETYLWVDNSAAPYSGLATNAGSFQISAGFTTILNSTRSPIFYDSDNTTYYVDAASTSSFNALNLASTLAINGGDGIRVFKSPASSVTSQIYWANGANTVAYNWQIDENSNAAMWGYTSAWGKLLTVTSAGAFSASGDVRAPIFYDSANTAYYLDPANTGTSLLVAGNVGIGTTSPSAKLHVYNGSSHFEATSTGAAVISSGLYALQIGPLHDRLATTGSYYGGIAFNHLLNYVGSSAWNGAPQAWIGTRLQDTAGSERDYLVFATKPGTGTTGTGNDIPIERMCIDRDGLVGIGTTSPATKLEVASTSDGILTLNKSSGTAWNYINFSQAGTRRFYFGLNASFEPELGVDNGGTFRVVGGMTVAGNAVLTSTSTLTAGNLSGTIPSGVLGNSTHYVGTTAITLNRGSASQTLTGVSIDGNAATATNGLTTGNYGGYSTFSGIVSSAVGGFQTATYAAGRNRIWSFGNSDGYGLAYFQGSGGVGGYDIIGMHFGTATAAASQYQFNAIGSFTATGDVRAPIFYDSNNTAYYLDPANSGTSLLVAGKVGIGTVSPLGLLEVRGTNRLISNDGLLQVNSINSVGIDLGGSVSFGGSYVGTNVTEWAQLSGRKETATSGEYGGYLDFATRPHLGLNTSRIRITSTGNVGIGTTSPGAPLEVSGTSGDSLPTFKVTSTTAPNSFNYAGTILNSSLGAGRNYVLFIGKASSTKNAAYIGYNHSGTDGSNTNFLTLGHYASDNLLNILGNGNVGIGTTSPSLISGYVGLNVVNAGYTQIKLQSSASSAGIEFKPSSGNNWELQANTSSQWFVFDRTQDVYRLLINSSGNVGIGTASPSQKLHVVGTAYSDTDFRAPIFYDSNDTGYFLNPNSTSNLNNLRAATISAANHGLTCVYYGGGATPTNGYLITTNIDYSTFNMPTVIIEGYAYGSAAPIHLEIVWYAYNNSWTNLSYTNLGAWDVGTISIGTNASGKVCLHLSNLIYYGRFNIRCIYDGGNAPLEGWTVTDATTSALTRVTTISKSAIVTSITGNSATVTTNANLTGHITSVGNATSLGSFTSAQLLAALTDETGTGANVFATSPTLVSPILGTPTSGNLANCTFPTLNQNTTGTSSNITAYTINQSVGTANSPTFATLQLTRLNFGATGATPYAAAAGEGTGNGITFGGDEAGAGYRIFTSMENWNGSGNYSKLTLNWHTGIKIGAYTNYGGIRFYNNAAGATNPTPSEIFSIGRGDSNVRVENTIYAQSFYDINNTAYYLDPAAGTSLRIAGAIVGDHAAWTGEQNKIQWHSSHLYFQNTSDGYFIFRKSNGAEPFQLRIGEEAGYATGSWRAPIFYDSNDTAYYLDPRSTSVLSGLKLNGIDNEAAGTGSDAILWINKPNNNDWGIRVTGNLEYLLRLEGATSHSYNIQGLANGSEFWRCGTDLLYHNSNIRAPIFYDNNDTAYYVDPASATISSNLKASQAIGRYKTFAINDLSAGSINARTYEIARIAIDYNDWNTIGTFEVELHEQYWSQGLKKVYNIWYGYVNDYGIRLVEWRGSGSNGFQCRIGSPVQVVGDQYYLPIYIDVRNYSIVDVVIKTNRNYTTSSPPAIGYTYINTAPSASNITDFTPDNDLEISTRTTAKLGGNVILTAANYNSYSPTLTGTGASGTWSINVTGNASGTAASISGFNNPTTAATANTIVYRDGSGHITGNYIFGSYLNSTDEVSTGNISHIMAKFGDNYHRSATAAKVATFISGQTMNIAGSSTSCTGNAASATTAAACTGNAATVTNGVYTGTTNTLTGGNLFQSNLGTTSGSLSSPPLQVYATGTNAAFMSFHRAGSYAVNMGLDSDNVLRIGGWSASANRLQLDMSGNLTIAAGMYATGFYDTNNTALYCDPTGTSLFTGLTVTNTITGSITGNAGGSSASCTGNSATVTVNYNNDSNASYQMLWGSGNSVYGTAGVTLNPSTDYITATSFNASDWFRSSGNTGWYNSTWGGGIYMTDSTWIRTYNSKYFYCDTIIQAGSDMRSPRFYDGDNTAYYVDPASTSILNLVRTRNTFGERITVTSASSTTIDTQYNVTELTMSAFISTLTFSNIQASGIVHMWTIVTLGNGSATSVTWPAAIKWPGGTAPNITGTNTKRDIYQFVTYDGGTNIYAIIVGQNL